MEDKSAMDVKPSFKTHSSPGLMLQQAREEKKLSQADVAKEMRLSLQWVKDIENDDYAHGAAIIYIRGYLRSYARLVGLSPDDVINAFESMDLEEEFNKAKSTQEKVVLQPTVPVFSKQTRFMSRRTVRWVSGIALLVMVVLVAMWWQGQRKRGIDQMSQTQPQIPIQPTPEIVKPQLKANDQMNVLPQPIQKNNNKQS